MHINKITQRVSQLILAHVIAINSLHATSINPINVPVEVQIVISNSTYAHFVACTESDPVLNLILPPSSTDLTVNYVSGGTATNIKSSLPDSNLPGVTETANNCSVLSATSPSCTITFQAGSSLSTAQVMITGTNMIATPLCIHVIQ